MPDDRSFAEAANDIGRRREVVVHHVVADAVPSGTTAGGLAGSDKISKPKRKWWVRLEAIGVVGAVAAVLVWAAGFVFPQVVPWADRTCAGAGGTNGSATKPIPSPDEARRLYEADKEAIVAENRRVEELGRKGYTVKTVVYIGSGITEGFNDEPQFNLVLPELRGIRLAHAAVNDMADADPRDRRNLDGKVYIRVDVREAGDHFAHAPAIAAEVAEEAGRQVLGVIGLGESRRETLEAQRILGEGGLPMMGMGATSESLQGNPLYRQVSWDNRRQAMLIADFIDKANLVPDGSDGNTCNPAERAVVIGDPADDYSRTLSQDVVEAFPGSERIWSSDVVPPNPPGKVVTNLSDLAVTTCNSLARDPQHTVLVWTGRAARLRDLLREIPDEPRCPPTFTVVAGDTINATITRAEDFAARYPGVTIYHAAHALPASSPNPVGDDFNKQYLDTYPGDDAWRDHWRAPIAYDGLLSIVEAINSACRRNLQAGCGRGSVQSQLAGGIGGPVGMLGATGSIRFVKGQYKEVTVVPTGKRFLMLRSTANKPRVVMECGERRPGDVRETWDPDNEHPCPAT